MAFSGGLLASPLRLGIVANFISAPVLVGFRAGIGVVIVVDQIPKILGIHFTRGTFVQNVLLIVHTLPKTSLATLAVGLTIIVFLLSMERFLPKLPAPLLKMFAQVAKRQSQHGVRLWLIGMTPRVFAIVQRSPLGQLLRHEGMHFNLELAVGRYLRDELVPEQP
jgi:MFS superfamily sulfate permease-like transporter